MSDTSPPSHMYLEASEASAVVARQRRANATLIADLAARLRHIGPRIIFTCARGSSDHAATFARYLIETRLAIPTSSQAPSIGSIYGGGFQHMAGQPFILVSQSGKSPDLLLSAEAARKAGALVIAFVNTADSPLALLADVVVPLHAGPEQSVAATKSFIATLAAFVQLVGEWTGDGGLRTALDTLPPALDAAWTADWSPGIDTLAGAASMFVLGRGLTLAVAQEAALKFKETCGIHAEAFSVAEVAHGPMALVTRGFPVLIFPPPDAAAEGLELLVARFAERGASLIVAGAGEAGAVALPLQDGLHPAIAPIVMIQSFYAMVNALSVRRGYDPDRPPLLSKVTETR